jgi:hypothetical protein
VAGVLAYVAMSRRTAPAAPVVGAESA